MTRPTIGLFVGSTDYNGYENRLIEGAISAADEVGVRLVCLDSGYIQVGPVDQSMRNILYSLAGPATFDALVFSPAITHFADQGGMDLFFRNFSGIPTVGIVNRIPGSPRVLPDNESGMAELMDHLLEVHGYRRFAFIGGPPGQPEGESRFGAFSAKLRGKGLPVLPDWTAWGDYSRDSGYGITKEWLDRGRLDVDVIVCANDGMAFGAHEALRQQGLRVPEDIALTGFDDDEESLVHDPGLTTVNQDPEAQVAAAIKLALRNIADPSLAETVTVSSRATIRASCGCPAGPAALPADHQAKLDILGRLRAEEQVKQIILLGERLADCQTKEHTIEVIAAALRGTGFTGMGFKAIWLSLFASSDQPEAGLVQQLAALGPDEQDARALEFASSGFVPGGIRELDARHGVVVVEVLYFHATHLGIMAFSIDSRKVRLTGAIRNQIAGAFQNVRLLELRRAAERRLVHNAKMAALGNLVAGLAHEINTPLGIAVLGASHIKTSIADCARNLEATGAHELAGTISSSLPVIDLVNANLEKVAELVTVFKEIALVQANEARTRFELPVLATLVLSSQSGSWPGKDLEWTVEGDANLEIESYPQTLTKILALLFKNACTHAFLPDRPGAIRIAISLDEAIDQVSLRFEDNGPGVPPANIPLLFEPFFTTRRGRGGIGLGLYIVNNLVTQVLAGSIHCENRETEGTAFVLAFPRVAPPAPSEAP